MKAETRWFTAAEIAKLFLFENADSVHNAIIDNTGHDPYADRISKTSSHVNSACAFAITQYLNKRAETTCAGIVDAELRCAADIWVHAVRVNAHNDFEFYIGIDF